jgi:hypothetical protein
MLFKAKTSPTTVTVRSYETGLSTKVSITPEAVTAKIPFSFPKWLFYPLSSIGIAYFTFACVYDIVYWIAVKV